MYRSHAMSPDCAAAMKSLRFLFVIATHCSHDMRDACIQMWHHADTEYEAPVTVAHTVCLWQKFDWIEPFTVKIKK